MLQYNPTDEGLEQIAHMVADKVKKLREGIELAKATISQGKCRKLLERFIKATS